MSTDTEIAFLKLALGVTSGSLTDLRQQYYLNAMSGLLSTAVNTRIALRTPLRFADIDLNALNSFGVSKTANVMSAATSGTEGRFWTPLWSGNSFRASATVKATKATTGSYSVFGLSDSTTGSDPNASGWLGAGYVQGVGIVLRRSVATGQDAVLIADSAITDGTSYTVTLVFDGVMHAAGVPGEFTMQAIVTNADGTIAGRGTSYLQFNYFSGTGSFVARTTVISGLTDLQVSQSIGGDVLAPSGLTSEGYMPGVSSERMALRIPARPNGKLVIALHGRGVDQSVMFDSNQYNATWRALLASGYTIAMPNLGGDLWGNATAQSYLAACRDAVCAALNLDRKVFLWGSSMGGGAALTAIGKQTLGANNVYAAYLAQPVCDIQSVYNDNSGVYTEIPSLYPSADAYAAASPVLLPTKNYANIPLLFVASPADGTVSKTKNTDTMRTKLNGVTRTALLVAAGPHEDPSEFQAQACLSWFQTV